jgi:Uma2 family endonuclease
MTVDEYERIGGMLDDDCIELIDGYLVKKMSKNPPHITGVENVLQALTPLLPAGFFCRKEDPVQIPDFDEPEPDTTVLRGSRQDYRSRIPQPRDVALLVEVSETTLDRDRGPKLAAFAKAGMPVYWIVNLVDHQVEVYSSPSPDGYKVHHDFKPGQDIPLVIDGVEVGRIAVADILP